MIESSNIVNLRLHSGVLSVASRNCLRLCAPYHRFSQVQRPRFVLSDQPIVVRRVRGVQCSATHKDAGCYAPVAEPVRLSPLASSFSADRKSALSAPGMIAALSLILRGAATELLCLIG